MGHAWKATGGNGFSNFWAGNHYRDTLGRQREATDLVTFGLGITTGASLGGNERQPEAMDLVTFELGITSGTGLEGNGRQRRK